MKRSVLALLVVGCLIPANRSTGSDVPDAPVFVASGPTGEIVEVDTLAHSASTLFSAGGGFRPESMVIGGDGLFYICDSSNSEIFRLDVTDPQDPALETIYDRNSAVSPNDPEQPRGCTIRGADLYFLSRRGRGASSETGVWVISDVVGSPPPFAQPQLVFPLDALGIGGEGVAVGPDGRFYLTFGTQIVRVAADLSGFEVFDVLSGEGFGIAVNNVGEIFVALKFQGFIEFFEETNNQLQPCGTGVYAYVPPGEMPGSIGTDASDNLWVTSSQQSNGRRGSVFFIERSSAPTCAAPGPAAAPTLVVGGLSAASGIALGPTQSEPVQFTFTTDGDKASTDFCATLYSILAESVTPACLVDVSCRWVTQAEFRTRTAGTEFEDTICASIPNSQGNCLEIRSDNQRLSTGEQQQCIADITAELQFYAAPFTSPGLLYSPGALSDPPVNPVTQNILIDFDPVPNPDDPFDPRMTGSRDNWGSGVFPVDNAPNRPPVADARIQDPDNTNLVKEITVCAGVPVTLDGSLSDDLDYGQSLASWEWFDNGSMIATGETATVGSLGAGTHTVSLTVSDDQDPALSSDPGNEFWELILSPLPSDEVTITVLEDLVPTWSADPTFADGSTSQSTWPPNHEMVPYEVMMVVNDNCDATCRIVDITSDDPVNGTGDGDAAPDWELLDANGSWFDPEVAGYAAGAINCTGTSPIECRQQFRIRSERSENDPVAPDRTYTIYMECTDGTSTTEQRTVTVVVDDNQGGEL